MSEYQYYEFLALDRPLTRRQMQELRSWSTRADITPTSFVNEYHWGDFKGDPRHFLREYFDVFLYYANWGTHQFAFRVPADLIDVKTARPYAVDHNLTIKPAGKHVLIEMETQDEHGDYEGEGGAGRMAALSPIRGEVIAGDFRPLYVAWLSAVQAEHVADDKAEPPLPAGLAKLTAPQRALADYLRIDESLLDVAGKGAPVPAERSRDMAAWLIEHPQVEKDDLLVKFCEGAEPLLPARLRQRFEAAHAKARSNCQSPTRRTVATLLGALRRAEDEREQERLRAQERERLRREVERAAFLGTLAGRAPAAWKEIEDLISTRGTDRYARAITLLRDLRDATERAGASADFNARLASLVRLHARKGALLKRMSREGLLQG